MKLASGATALLLAGILSAQSFSSHSGWNFDDTLQTATSVVVADIVRGAGVDNGTQVNVQANIRVVRVLQGEIAPGAELTIEWNFKPGLHEPPAASAVVPAVRALWFLRVRTDGSLEPLLASASFDAFGGFFLEVPAAPIGYPPDADLETKVALEIGAALEDLATRHAADLAPHAPPARSTPVPRESARARNRFNSLIMTFTNLKKKPTAEVYRRFSMSSEANLKLFGLLGRAANGDPAALCDMENDLPHLATASSVLHVTSQLMRVDLQQDLRAAHCMARMALAEVTLPGLDALFAFRAGSTHRLEFAPYLNLLLASPDPGTRGAAIAAFCELTGRASAEITAHCPNSVPVNDPEEERRAIEFWSRWWDSRRDEVGKTTNLPRVVPPSRYTTASQSSQRIEVPLEVRFDSLLNMVSDRGTHYHRMSPDASTPGDMVNEPPPAFDPVTPALAASDVEVWREITGQTNAKLAATDKRGMDLMNAARIQGVLPPEERMQALYQDRLAILKAALQQLQSRLSPKGWETLLNLMPKVSGFRMAAPVN